MIAHQILMENLCWLWPSLISKRQYWSPFSRRSSHQILTHHASRKESGIIDTLLRYIRTKLYLYSIKIVIVIVIKSYLYLEMVNHWRTHINNETLLNDRKVEELDKTELFPNCFEDGVFWRRCCRFFNCTSSIFWDLGPKLFFGFKFWRKIR